MKYGWLWKDRLRLPADDGGDGGGGGDEGDKGNKGGNEKKTFNINGKNVDPETAAAALNLYNSLADPEVGKEIIEQLARRTGLLKDNHVPDKKEQKQLEGKFTKMMKTKLGKDYDKFSDTLGPVFDEAMSELINELKEEIGGKTEASSWEGVVENFFEDNRTTPELEREMERIIKRNGGRPAGLKGKAAKEYLQDMYELAAHKLNLNLKTLKKISVESDETDDTDEDDEPVMRRSNRRSRRNDIPDFREVARPKGTLTVDEIVDAAMKGIRFKN